MICEKCVEDKALYRSFDGSVTAVPPGVHSCDVVRVIKYKVSRMSFSDRFWRLVKAARETPTDRDEQTWSAMVEQGSDAPSQTSPSAYVVYYEK